jgi:hypothetical protein
MLPLMKDGRREPFADDQNTPIRFPLSPACFCFDRSCPAVTSREGPCWHHRRLYFQGVMPFSASHWSVTGNRRCGSRSIEATCYLNGRYDPMGSNCDLTPGPTDPTSHADGSPRVVMWPGPLAFIVQSVGQTPRRLCGFSQSRDHRVRFRPSDGGKLRRVAARTWTPLRARAEVLTNLEL